MAVKTRPVPEHEFQLIANTVPDLVNVAESMDRMVTELKATEPERAERLRAMLHRVLDNADAIAESVIVATKATAN